ncbi:MAG TPA: Lsr2 family protein [Pseudonocardiaceae bacterium]|nr:Lsr2 family protein [Pseudonocardiaceae bacterium]
MVVGTAPGNPVSGGRLSGVPPPPGPRAAAPFVSLAAAVFPPVGGASPGSRSADVDGGCVSRPARTRSRRITGPTQTVRAGNLITHFPPFCGYAGFRHRRTAAPAVIRSAITACLRERETMARKVLVRLVDDLDGLPSEDVATVTFSLDRVTYQIDLNAANASKLRDGLADFVAAARRTGGRVRRGAGRTGGATNDGPAIREWARQHGHELAERGRIPSHIVDAFRASGGGRAKATAPAEATPAKPARAARKPAAAPARGATAKTAAASRTATKATAKTTAKAAPKSAAAKTGKAAAKTPRSASSTAARGGRTRRASGPRSR